MEMLSEGGGVLSNNRKFDFILLFLGQRRTQLSKQTIKINFYQKNVIGTVYAISNSSLWP